MHLEAPDSSRHGHHLDVRGGRHRRRSCRRRIPQLPGVRRQRLDVSGGRRPRWCLGVCGSGGRRPRSCRRRTSQRPTPVDSDVALCETDEQHVTPRRFQQQHLCTTSHRQCVVSFRSREATATRTPFTLLTLLVALQLAALHIVKFLHLVGVWESGECRDAADPAEQREQQARRGLGQRLIAPTALVMMS